MAFVAAATSVGAAVLGTGAAAGIGSTLLGGALIGAGVGGLYSGITGDGDILNSMLTGGLLGAGGAALGSAMGLGAASGGAGGAAGGAGATGAGGTVASQAAAPMATAVQTASPAAQAAAANAANLEALALAEASPTAGMVGAANTGLPANTVLPASMQFTPPVTQTATGLTGKEMLGYGLAGSAALSLLGGSKPTSAGSPPEPGMIRPYQYSANPTEATGEYPSPYATTRYDSAGLPILDTRERKYFSPSFTALEPYKAAQGGLMMAYGGPVERMSAMDQQRGMYPQGMIDKTYYAAPTQRPASMEIVRSDYDTPVNPITGLQPMGMAEGGLSHLGSYSDGGRLLKGPGDGMSDNIPAMIGKKQPARLADGEFVVPADVVSHLGNGSTDAGAKRLYAMMDKVRKARTGNKKQGKQIKAEKFLPA